jgi:hypothetical protein
MGKTQLKPIGRIIDQASLGPFHNTDRLGIGEIILDADIPRFIVRDAVKIEMVDTPALTAIDPGKPKGGAHHPAIEAHPAGQAPDKGGLTTAQLTIEADKVLALEETAQTPAQNLGLGLPRGFQNEGPILGRQGLLPSVWGLSPRRHV